MKFKKLTSNYENWTDVKTSNVSSEIEDLDKLIEQDEFRMGKLLKEKQGKAFSQGLWVGTLIATLIIIFFTKTIS